MKQLKVVPSALFASVGQACLARFWGTVACGVVASLLLAGPALARKCISNGILDKGELCDPQGQIFKGDATCATFGYLSGTLLCTDTCEEDTSGCISQEFPATGQTTSFGTGSDGNVQAGAALNYTDNGDGTITDENTQLMWEIKDHSGSIHDVDNTYTWCDVTSFCPTNDMDGTIKTVFLNTLNDVAGGGLSCFAGHCDWRIPNAKELQSIVNYGDDSPSVSTEFNNNCVADCLATACSCTRTINSYWTSTTESFEPLNAWGVLFFGGQVTTDGKNGAHPVRAVRGGLLPLP